MTMILPTIPTSLPAGYVVTATDLNNLANACTFLMNKPLAHVHDSLGTQTIGTGATAVQFNVKDLDNDGMYSSGNNTRLTVQTPGFYESEYFIDCYGAGGSVWISTYLQITTGANNPLGSGITQSCWAGHGSAGVASSYRSGARGGGLLPLYMYMWDYVELYALVSTAAPTSTAPVSFLSMEFVSV